MSVKKYCYCENNCKYETLSKEEIFAAIAQAIETGEVGECDTGFITTIKTINGTPLRFFVDDQAAYDALTAEQKINLFAIITNDTTKDNLLKALEDLKLDIDNLKDWKINTLTQKSIETVRIGTYTDEYNTTLPIQAAENVELEEGKSYIFCADLGGTLSTMTFILYCATSEKPCFSTITRTDNAFTYHEYVLSYNPSTKRLQPLQRYIANNSIGEWKYVVSKTTIYYREI